MHTFSLACALLVCKLISHTYILYANGCVLQDRNGVITVGTAVAIAVLAALIMCV